MKYPVYALLLATACLFPIAAGAQSKPTNIYVSVLDGKGDPVKNLAASDFHVTEDGVAREVLKAAPATDPLTVALLVDDSQASTRAIQQIRQGVEDFVTGLAGKGEISIVSFGERPEIITDYTSDQKKLLDGAKKIFARPGSGAYLLEAIEEVCHGLEKRNAARPVIAVLMLEDVEFSNLYYQRVLDELNKAGATLHVISLGQPAGPTTDENRNRDLVVSQGTHDTGGRRDQVLAMTGIPFHMQQLAAELSNQYVVTYARPEQLIPPKRVDVTVSKADVTVRARTRTGVTGAR